MIDTLTSTPFFGLGLTLLCWFLAVKLQKRTGLLVCNPVLVAAMLVIAVMVVFRIPLENYNAGGGIIKMLLAPATAVLALNVYQQRAVLKRYFWPVVLGCFVGSLVSVLAVLLLMPDELILPEPEFDLPQAVSSSAAATTPLQSAVCFSFICYAPLSIRPDPAEAFGESLPGGSQEYSWFRIQPNHIRGLSRRSTLSSRVPSRLVR